MDAVLNSLRAEKAGEGQKLHSAAGLVPLGLKVLSMRWSNGLFLHLGDLQLELVASLCHSQTGKVVFRDSLERHISASLSFQVFCY